VRRAGAAPGALAVCAAVALAACEPAPRPAPPAESPEPVAEAPPTPPALALTIDDLPWIGPVRPGATRADALERLIADVVARDVPALGFANCDRAAPGAPLLRRWLDAGLELGNHSAAHLDLNRAPLAQWLADVRRCDAFLRTLTGAERLWFRYPFLHQGPTPERQAAALALLEELDAPVAHVTINTADWLLAVAFSRAVAAGDEGRAAAVADAFVDHVLRTTAHYQQVARDRMGRDVAHVLLLHANLLVAEHVGTLLDRLRAQGFRFVTLEAAQRDPVYAAPDDYTGGAGLSWLYRMAPAMPELQAWDDAEARRLRLRWR
jgi:peptidoglycan-N-acetylglucosamine deacetylase